jgi:hypothetical protein
MVDFASPLEKPWRSGAWELVGSLQTASDLWGPGTIRPPTRFRSRGSCCDPSITPLSPEQSGLLFDA